MQYKLVVSILFSFLAIAVSAAPVPEPVLHDREIWRVPSVGVTDIAREVAPPHQDAPPDSVTDDGDSDVERDTEEARGCRMYACI